MKNYQFCFIMAMLCLILQNVMPDGWAVLIVQIAGVIFNITGCVYGCLSAINFFNNNRN